MGDITIVNSILGASDGSGPLLDNVSLRRAGMALSVAEGQTFVTDSIATGDGLTYEISGGADANAYEANLTTFIANMRDRYGADMRFVIGKLSPTFSGAVTAAQEAVAAADSRNYIVNTDNFELLPDYVHYSTAGTLDLGIGFATVISADFENGQLNL